MNTWQSQVETFVEENFEIGFAHGQFVNSFMMGGVMVTVTLPNVGGLTNGSIFAGGFGGAAGGQPGTVFGNALLSCTTISCSIRDTAVMFSFSAPVLGFGAWVFDNGISSVDSFTMTANSQTSVSLDANFGSTAHTVEGFIGVKDTTGISSVTISNFNTTGAVFELDSLQLASLGRHD